MEERKMDAQNGLEQKDRNLKEFLYICIYKSVLISGHLQMHTVNINDVCSSFKYNILLLFIKNLSTLLLILWKIYKIKLQFIIIKLKECFHFACQLFEMLIKVIKLWKTF